MLAVALLVPAGLIVLEWDARLSGEVSGTVPAIVESILSLREMVVGTCVCRARGHGMAMCS